MIKPIFDPESISIEDWTGEQAVVPGQLTPQWLRQRFAAPPPWLPEVSNEHLMRQRINELGLPMRACGEFTRASVLLPIVVREQGLTMLLTQRTANLTDHPGQISLPGGRAEPEDASPVDTALRETEEEVGLARAHIEVIGSLPQYFTVTGYCIDPVVALVFPPFALRADPDEVAEIFEVPLAFLLDGGNHQRRSGEMGGQRRSFYAMPYERFFIWGATAHILRNLFHFLRA
ncbi:MAG: CoA pyrophosphatase [Janthinobacterium lividum]